MTLLQLKIFEAVARHLNITQASAELNTSQPAVSLQLKRLAEEYGVRFLSRIGHGVELTRQGRAFLDAIKPVLVQIENIEKKFKANQSASGARSLRVGGSSSVSISLLPKLLAVFRKNHPGLTFVLETNDSRIVERRILESELDIAVITNPSNSPLIVYEPYARHKVVAFADPASPLIGRTIKLKELAEHLLVLRKESSIFRELVKLGFSPKLSVQCEAAEAVKAAVYKKMGVGILHLESVEHDIAVGIMKRIRVPELEKLEVHSYIIYDGRKPLSAIADDFLNLLRERRKPTVPNPVRKIDAADRLASGRQRKVSELKRLNHRPLN